MQIFLSIKCVLLFVGGNCELHSGGQGETKIELARLKEISKVISVSVEGKKCSKRRRHDVLVLIFWLGALEFKILKYLFICCLNIFLGIFSRFSVHKS